MASAKQGVPAAQADVALQPFDGVVVQRIVVPEDIYAQLNIMLSKTKKVLSYNQLTLSQLRIIF